MLASQHRLPATQRLRNSRLRRFTSFSVKIAQNEQSVSRFAFIVRKTVDKRAVVRNRIRRIFRAGIESKLHEITPGYDMLFFLEKGIIEQSQSDVWQQIYQLLAQERLLQEENL